MTIPSNHEMGDEVWFLSSDDMKIRKGKITKPKRIYTNNKIVWEIEVLDIKDWNIRKMESDDEECFKTKEELYKFLTVE